VGTSIAIITFGMAELLEGLFFAWNTERNDYSKYVNSSSEFVNFYLYGASVIPLSEIQKPLYAHSSVVQVLSILVFILQRYQTLISSFVSVISVVAARGAHSIARSAYKSVHEDRPNDLEVSPSQFHEYK